MNDIELIPPDPSFENWVGRVKTARGIVGGAALAISVYIFYHQGVSWEDAILRGIAVAIAAWFAGWALALWVCGEMYLSEVRRQRKALERREIARRRQMQLMYMQRAREMGLLPDTDSGSSAA